MTGYVLCHGPGLYWVARSDMITTIVLVPESRAAGKVVDRSLKMTFGGRSRREHQATRSRCQHSSMKTNELMNCVQSLVLSTVGIS